MPYDQENVRTFIFVILKVSVNCKIYYIMYARELIDASQGDENIFQKSLVKRLLE